MLDLLTLDGPAPPTLARAIALDGRGLHGGERSRVVLEPVAAAGWWLMDRRGMRHRIEHARVVDTTRCTTLELPDGTLFRTVEHVLAAVSGMGLDGVALRLEGGREVPALDGSALPFCAAISAAGLRALPEVPRQVWVLREALELRDPEDPRAFVRLRPFELRDPPAPGAPAALVEGDRRAPRAPVEPGAPRSAGAPPLPSGTATLALQAPPGWLGRRFEVAIEFPALPAGMPQTCTWSDEVPFAEAVAPARTFAFASWLTSLWRNGLARGGRPDNALVFDDLETPGALLGEGLLRTPDEPVRHKLLDLLGDLARLGRPLLAAVEARRPGHRLNALLVDHLLALTRS